jgi:hypothetical protein
MSAEFEEERKSNDQAYGNITFVDFHFGLSPRKILYIHFTLEKEFDDRFSIARFFSHLG